MDKSDFGHRDHDLRLRSQLSACCYGGPVQAISELSVSAKKPEEPKPVAENTAAASQAVPAKKSMLGKLLLAGFVGGVIVVETAVFFLMVPSGAEVAALAETRLIHQAEVDHLLETHEDKSGEQVVEFDLGYYGVTFTPSGSDYQHRVEFKLFGTLQAKDLDKMKKLFAERENRFRHRLILEIRNSSIDELHENQLGLIQRRILATSSELLGEAILLSVGFGDYQVIED